MGGTIPHCIHCAALIERSSMRDGLNVRRWLIFRHPAGRRLADAFLVLFAIGSLSTFPSSLIADQSIQPRAIPNILSQRGKDLTALKAVMAITTAYDGGRPARSSEAFSCTGDRPTSASRELGRAEIRCWSSLSSRKNSSCTSPRTARFSRATSSALSADSRMSANLTP